ncbi:MAG: hypothetical protein IJ026_02050 [Candidatus Methanomethylophilaceae archaeon]|nr:hypothetical protein [Candidatus Methanomethylophilaceae archaeon]
MDEVHVVEVATTGTSGFPRDRVYQVAVCRMFADGSDFDTVFHGSVCLDPRDLGKEALDRMSSVYGTNPEELYMGDPEADVVRGFQGSVFGRECTSFDVNTTFGKYLCYEPWDTTREVTLLPPVSCRLPRDARTPVGDVHPIRHAYSVVCPGDPAEVGDRNGALELAQMSVSVLMVLRRNGMF